MRVHQLIPCFTPGDAMGQAAVAWQRELRHLGLQGEVYAAEVARGYGSLVRDARHLRVAPDDLVLYHHGIASPLAGRLMHLRCRKGVVFHNITPARFYRGAALAEALVSGRAQLAALAAHVDVSLGVSRYNARELEAAGHTNVHVVPLFVEPERFARSEADLGLLESLGRAPGPLVVSVSRVVPHKRMEDLLSLHAELKVLHPDARLAIIGGFAAGHRDVQALQTRARQLGGVRFLGRVSHAQLVAAYRAADVYVSMSEHEGFGVPLVEAMAADLPVLAYGAAAVPETMGGRGLCFDEKHFAALAEVVSLLHRDAGVRAKVVAGQQERVAELSPLATRTALGQALFRFLPPVPATRRKASRPRVAVVVQRYGEHLTGGAEAHARAIAQRLAEHATVEVLTTCAKDHLTWANEWPAGQERDGRVRVTRFPVRAPREMRAFNRLSRSVFNVAQDLVAEEHWLAEQGPVSPELLEHLAAHRDRFDAFLFFTALYAPTAWGLPLVGPRAMLVPTAHDEPPMRFHAYRGAFEAPQVLMCNTPEEEAFIRERFPLAARSRVVGVGITAPRTHPRRFAEQYGLQGPYLMYVGRLEAGKGVPDLVKYHQALVARFHDAPTLVLAGGGDLAPRGDKVRVLGRIDEQDKWDGLAGALAAVVPSRFESLSLLALEAFAVGTPVLGHSGSPVVVGQLQRSQAGFAWNDAGSFGEAVKRVGEERAVLGANAKQYARGARWDRVMRAYLEELARLETRA